MCWCLHKNLNVVYNGITLICLYFGNELGNTIFKFPSHVVVMLVYSSCLLLPFYDIFSNCFLPFKFFSTLIPFNHFVFRFYGWQQYATKIHNISLVPNVSEYLLRHLEWEMFIDYKNRIVNLQLAQFIWCGKKCLRESSLQKINQIICGEFKLFSDFERISH